MPRKLLRAVPPLAWGAGKDTTLCGALEAALRAAGDEREDLYDRLMGASGAAFRFRFDPERWDPEAASPHNDALVARAARAAGVRPDIVAPPFDDELRELVWARIAESVDASLPPLARGLAGAPEFGVIVGYDDTGKVLFARTYVDKGKEPARLPFEDLAFVFLDRATRPADAALAREVVALAPRIARQPDPDEDAGVLAGDAAFEAWISGLRAEVRPAEAAARAFADWWLRVSLHDARRAAARFLRHTRALLPDRPGAELLRAAESYGYVADEAAKGGLHPFDGTVVTRFLDASLRRGWANALERAITHEREALAALEHAT